MLVHESVSVHNFIGQIFWEKNRKRKVEITLSSSGVLSSSGIWLGLHVLITSFHYPKADSTKSFVTKSHFWHTVSKLIFRDEKSKFCPHHNYYLVTKMSKFQFPVLKSEHYAAVSNFWLRLGEIDPWPLNWLLFRLELRNTNAQSVFICWVNINCPFFSNL